VAADANATTTVIADKEEVVDAATFQPNVAGEDTIARRMAIVRTVGLIAKPQVRLTNPPLPSPT